MISTTPIKPTESIGDNIEEAKAFNKVIMHKWDSVRDVLKEKYSSNEKEITPVQAEKYRGDLYGLLENELNVPKEYLYPTMIVNDYSSPAEYDAGKLRFNLPVYNVLRNYYRLFIKP